jgi:site-specific recombinase XerD
MKGFKLYLKHRKGHSDTTISGYTKHLKLFIDWLEREGIEPKHVRHQDIVAYMRHIDIATRSPQTIKQMVVAVRHYYDYLVMTGKVRSNPAVGVIKRGERKRALRDVLTEEQLHNLYTSFPENTLMGIRNKMIVGLLVYQGLNAGELARLEVKDIDLKKGLIHVPAQRRSNPRTMKLEIVQLEIIKVYITRFRQGLLMFRRERTNRLIISAGFSPTMRGIFGKLIRAMKKVEPKFINVQQVRASVIANWLRKYDQIKVMHMAGFRYVSSTEYYAVQDIESLRDELDRMHPLENIQ